MMVLHAEAIRKLDLLTIQKGIASHELMERASLACTNWFLTQFSFANKIFVFCGQGNNGGDGFCIARQLFLKGYQVEVIIVTHELILTHDSLINFERIKKYKIPYIFFEENVFLQIKENDFIIDAILGTGLNKPVKGIHKLAIEKINNTPATIISVDVPSGFFCDSYTSDNCIHADYTFSFEFPKLGFFFPENNIFTGQWIVQSIGLANEKMEDENVVTQYVMPEEIKSIIKQRNNFAHKGTFGHTLIIAGSYGMEGASALCGKSCLVTGSGLVTLCSNSQQYTYPELMFLHEREYKAAIKSEKYNAIAVGPGLGMGALTQEILEEIFSYCKKPLVLDADALNTLSENKNLLEEIPAFSILTPHPKEFERLFGKTENSFDEHILQKEMSKKYKCIIILKRKNTCITTPHGQVFFNSTGNAGMATAGSGDVLTGILSALLAQHYTPQQASVLGVYLHGYAADLALQSTHGQNINATDIIAYIQNAYSEFI